LYPHRVIGNKEYAVQNEKPNNIRIKRYRVANTTLLAVIFPILMAFLLLLVPSSTTVLNFNVVLDAVAQTSPSSPSPSNIATNTFEMDGQIGSLILGMPPNTKTVDMTAVPKFILSGDWTINVAQGNLSDFSASFYTGPVNGAENHTHQLSNFRVSDNAPIQLSPDKSLSLSGIVDVGTNGNKAWNNVNATVDVSKGRSITISLADEDTQRHFMGQQIYGIVQGLKV
jgi:hypothetical protein